jgi:hypothetical protein
MQSLWAKLLNKSNMSRWLRTAIVAVLGLITPLALDTPAYTHSNIFELVTPPHVSVTLFAIGYGNEKYGSTQGGFQLEQSVNGLFGLVGRASAYQILKGILGYDSPLSPSSKSAPRDFGRFQGGIDLTPFQGISLVLLGGEDVGDSHAPVVEGDFSSWFGIHTAHPFNISFTGSHYYQNGVTSGTYDLRTMAMSTANFILLLGGGGAIWGGGSKAHGGPEIDGLSDEVEAYDNPAAIKAHGGPEIGIFLRRWHLSVEVQAGYGSAHTYGVVSVSRQFTWDE